MPLTRTVTFFHKHSYVKILGFRAQRASLTNDVMLPVEHLQLLRISALDYFELAKLVKPGKNSFRCDKNIPEDDLLRHLAPQSPVTEIHTHLQ
jgi:hypothetical protein